MDRKIIFAIAAVALVLLVSGIAVLALSGDDKAKKEEIPRLDTYPELKMDLVSDSVMVGDAQTIYFPVSGGNGSEVMLVYSVTANIRWSDDEQPPIFRPTYNNEPDLFQASVYMPASDGNGTANTTASSDSGNLNLILKPIGKPGAVKGSGQANWSFPAQGVQQPGANETFFVSVECSAGDIRSSGTRLLLYNDPGDEIVLTLSLVYKIVPLYVYEHYFIKDTV